MRKVFLFHDTHCSDSGCTRQWISTKCRAMTARRQILHVVTDQHCAHWHTACQRFCTSQHIRCDAKMLNSKHFSCATKPRLDLVHDQQHATLITNPLRSLDIFCCSRIYAALSLYYLQNDSSSFFIHRL